MPPPAPAPVLPPPDTDGDGFHDGQDCNPTDPTIRPGALEVKGNAVDENCDGRVEPFPLIAAPLRMFFKVGKSFTKVSEFTVANVPTGAVVEIRCKAPKRRKRACPFTLTRRSFPAAQRRVNLLGRLKNVRLPSGTVLDARVLAPDTVGRARIERIRRGRSPLSQQMCLTPGAARPAPCV